MENRLNRIDFGFYYNARNGNMLFWLNSTYRHLCTDISLLYRTYSCNTCYYSKESAGIRNLCEHSGRKALKEKLSAICIIQIYKGLFCALAPRLHIVLFTSKIRLLSGLFNCLRRGFRHSKDRFKEADADYLYVIHIYLFISETKVK